MKDLFNKVKTANKAKIRKTNKVFLWIELSLILTGVVLLLIDVDRFSSVSALLIFFAFVSFIITLFALFLKARKNMQIKIKNSIDIVYQAYLKDVNKEHNTDYKFETDPKSEENWLLVPSFANKKLNLLLVDEKNIIKMFHGEAFNIIGDKQTKTYYFRGLYIMMPGPLGNYQYRDKDSISQKIINTFKSIYAEDKNDLKTYKNKTPYKTGYFYSDKSHDLPILLKALINELEKRPHISSFKIGLKDQQLHVAIEQSKIRLPYIKKYKEQELQDIKRVVKEYAELIQVLNQILNNYDI